MMYYVYIMSNQAGTLYTGVTNNLERRVYEHKHDLVGGFTSRCKVNWLVYYEATEDIGSAIAAEKRIKGLVRRRKVELIESMNPLWIDLSGRWF